MSYQKWVENLKRFTKNFDHPTGDRLIVANALLDTQPLDVQPEAAPVGLPAGCVPSTLSMAEIREIHAGKKISAIKLVRERTPCGLREAKDAVDNWCRDAGPFTVINPPASAW